MQIKVSMQDLADQIANQKHWAKDRNLVHVELAGHINGNEK